jgi:photosystem II stability/assembly factor-like uncharacterized protein
MTVSGAEKLDFRDIEAIDANTAYILSIGNGESSRIYKTINGGKSWNEQFRNKNEKAFFDAIACWRETGKCIAVSDPVDNKFVFIFNFGSDKWAVIESDMPAAKEGQAAFAASGTCLITTNLHHAAMLVTGGTASEVFTTDVNGFYWKSFKTPIVSGTSGSGIFSVDMYGGTAVIVGGNYEKPNEAKDNLAFSTDGGQAWTLGTGLSGYRSGVSFIDKKTIIAVGTNGTDITRDGGKTWKVFGKQDLNAVQSKGKRATWAVGPKGMVVKMK